MANYNTEDLAYAAGIIDGEGWIGMSIHDPKLKTSRVRSPRFQAQVVVRMTDFEVPVWLTETFGGSLTAVAPRAGCKPIQHWALTGAAAADFCRLVRPFLHVKHRQAETIIRYREDLRLDHTRHGGRGVRVPDEEIEVKREYATILRSLNARGVVKNV